MENKNVGYLLLGVAVVMLVVIFIFNNALQQIVNQSCTMAGHDSCVMFDTIRNQTYLALGIDALLVVVALFLVFSKQSERIIIKKVEAKKEKKEFDLAGLKSEELNVFKIIEAGKAVFQADLIEKTGFGKAKMTRILDRLEGRDLVERKRRGMTNVVVLKED